MRQNYISMELFGVEIVHRNYYWVSTERSKNLMRAFVTGNKGEEELVNLMGFANSKPIPEHLIKAIEPVVFCKNKRTIWERIKNVGKTSKLPTDMQK